MDLRDGNELPITARGVALLIAVLSWISLVWTAYDYGHSRGSWIGGLRNMSLFYTHWANLIIAVCFSGIALGKRAFNRPRVIGKLVIMILILLAIYWGFEGLHNFLHSPIRSKLIHALVPALVVLYWVRFVDRTTLRPVDALLWTIMPLAYVAAALLRGHFTGEFPYDIADVRKHGYTFVLWVVVLTTLSSLMVGLMLVMVEPWVRRTIDKRRTRTDVEATSSE